MGQGFSAIGPCAARRLLLVGLVAALAFSAQLLLAGQAQGGAYTGTFSPRIIGDKADVNGDLTVNGKDDANAFFGDTSIIDGMLDCDAWGATANEGSAGDETIDASDDCHLIAFDGTLDGRTIEVIDGKFQFPNKLLPAIFNATDPTDSSVADADFAWSTIGGRVDSNGNEAIDADGDDCHVDLIGTADDTGLGSDGIDVLGNGPGDTNPCGFAVPPNTAHNGLVDMNGDLDISAADSCSDSCFFGHDVKSGVVQAECPGFAGDPRNDVVGTSGANTLSGTSGGDIICGLGGNDTLNGKGGKDVVLGGTGADTLRGGDGADVLRGGNGRDNLFGADGKDRLYGNGKRDHLDGGHGFDRGWGGPGRDTFVRCEVRHQ